MPATKIDFKRELKQFYSAKPAPAMVEVPELSFLMIDGSGDPNVVAEYGQAIEALYSVSYTLKFTIKAEPDGFDYGVMPLEGLWWADDMASFTSGDKSKWNWTAMIMQPEIVTAERFERAREAAAERKDLPAAPKLRLEHFSEGSAAQALHVGPYASEGPTIERLHQFIADQGYALAGKHHEIYLSDPRRSAPEKLKTIVRQPVIGT